MLNWKYQLDNDLMIYLQVYQPSLYLLVSNTKDSDGADASSSAESCGDDDYVPGCEPVSDDSSLSQNSRQTVEDSSPRKIKENLTDNSDSPSDKDQRSHAPHHKSTKALWKYAEEKT